MRKVESLVSQSKQTTAKESVGFVRQKKLLQEYVPFSAATLWRLVKVGRFPQPIRIANQITVWRISDVMIWAQNPNSFNVKLTERVSL